MKTTLFSLVVVLLVLSGCKEEERNVCLEPYYLGNEHSIYDCACLNLVKRQIASNESILNENKQRLDELYFEVTSGKVSKEEAAEERELLQEQNELLIKNIRAQLVLLARHEELFHFQANLTSLSTVNSSRSTLN